jgi:hypothetical protein
MRAPNDTARDLSAEIPGRVGLPAYSVVYRAYRCGRSESIIRRASPIVVSARAASIRA